MKTFKRITLASLVSLLMLFPQKGRADMFGGDVMVLIEILANAISQLEQLRSIFGTGTDTLGLMREINDGIRDGLSIIQNLNPRFNPGLYGDLRSADRVLHSIQDLYGRIPETSEARLQATQDQSVAESIAMNSTLFEFADHADDESRRIIEHAQSVNPQGAAKLTAQSIAVLIGVTSQVLRTNSMMLKMMGENMALQNRKEKVQSAQFKNQYDGLSNAFSGLPKDSKLQSLDGGN